MYSLKVNVLNVLVQNARSHSTEIPLIHSSAVFSASVSTPHPDEFPDNCFVNNLTGIVYAS
ncbi:hypothetical protein EJF18_70110 [Clavispora lusitaniae]|uniref:Uncharacterized protein n=2 Tax=Clavispora lusitaniae TaxID=36911 RepID=A0ACD0WS87_CLALS|nr:hypothetical protein A9F13_16g01056 [Clavispora lusitaniae]QFZ30046.1 hypothetical protein EJF14_70110 [Clavispora lusitaniae]QFZ35710.1 hypothetical protein EJF16_70110 [Clavispora lusitaniae]QFZ41392.1 hypothetical protein EJF15_70110 [Clavispora lusitaniae]QFZ47070.1 hypothetical protein EJF18_70110 [Clavispora lusitaniae]